MLQELSVKNFKLFDEVGGTVRPGKITVLIGANGTGKSSLLQVLLLLKQSLHQSKLVLDGPLIDVGSFRDIVHLQDVTRAVEIGLSAPYDDFTFPGNIEPPLPSSGTVRYQALFRDGGGSDQIITIGGEGGETFASSSSSGSMSHDRITVGGMATITLQQLTLIGFPITPIAMDIIGNDPATQTTPVMNKVYYLLSTIDRLLRSLYFVPAIRGFDSLAYEISPTEQSGDLTAAGGPEKQASLVANIISASPDLVEEVTERLNRILRGDARLRYRLDQGRLVSEMARGRRGVNLFNEAFGLNQLIAPLLWLSKVPSGSVIGIEEPEIHLHPRAQAAFCDVFVEVATQEHKQLILTTHSEHILMGLLTAVADGRLRPDDLAVYEFRRQGDAARAERLAVNEYGQVAGGLKGFLEADLDEIGELIQARFQKQR